MGRQSVYMRIADPIIRRIWYNLRHQAMKRFQLKHSSRHICRRIAATILAFAAVALPLAARAEKANVFFIHGANIV